MKKILYILLLLPFMVVSQNIVIFGNQNVNFNVNVHNPINLPLVTLINQPLNGVNINTFTVPLNNTPLLRYQPILNRDIKLNDINLSLNREVRDYTNVPLTTLRINTIREPIPKKLKSVN